MTIEVKLGCGHEARLFVVPSVLQAQLFGYDKAVSMACDEEKKRAKKFSCSKYTCRKFTGKPTHEGCNNE